MKMKKKKINYFVREDRINFSHLKESAVAHASNVKWVKSDKGMCHLILSWVEYKKQTENQNKSTKKIKPNM